MSQGSVLLAAVGAARRASDERARSEARASIEHLANDAHPRAGALAETFRGTAGLRVIAECKRRSPSRGILRRDYDPAAIAAGYARAGAAAISVLTEPTFFDGSLDHLARVRATVDLPLLRKDFITTEFQLVEARAAGADAVLLIVAALDDRQLRALLQQAASHGLGALVEAHDVTELQRAVAAGATLVGVNCRDLKTLTIDARVFDEVARNLPRGVTTIAESGIRTATDAVRLAQLGYDGFLIGERFMSTPDPGAALDTFLDAARAVSR
jgi:indole-3-glycerol phosphate synthase